MGFDRRTFRVNTPTAATYTTSANLRSQYVRILGHVVDAVTDTDCRLRLTDADLRIFYLDAADKNYTTAVYTTPLGLSDLTTGTTLGGFDSTGVAAAADQISAPPVVKSPIEIGIVNGGTVGDYFDVTLEYEYGVFGALDFVLPTAAGNTSTLTKSLRSKYAQICGFRADSVGTDQDTILKISDADGRIVFLDAAGYDYDTTSTYGVDKTLLVDPTVTGLTRVVPRDSTGATFGATDGRMELPIVRSPLTLTASAQSGNDEVVTATVYYKTG